MGRVKLHLDQPKIITAVDTSCPRSSRLNVLMDSPPSFHAYPSLGIQATRYSKSKRPGEALEACTCSSAPV